MPNTNLKIYARSSALTIEPQVNAAGDVATVGFEAARKNTMGKTYDWANKIAVQLTARELPTVLAVLMGYKNDCEFRFHGHNRNKSYSLRSHPVGVGVTLSAAQSGSITVPIEPADLFALSTLIVQRMQLNHKTLSTDSLLDILKRSYVERSSPSPRSPSRRSNQTLGVVT